ncbi:DUF3696 domain-containing protein [Aeromonas enteropelogenes]|uniref:DUF3696 domain-containing protein n=1 Tax=Aeromonas enteropelogenes TaxID=29489 RepID=UPI00191E080B|nr:DUF3696 domain-containing protein [Aeromonas enteropelogenes]MBL0521668.1 DUF3696 domain-containing protein [Aeromonas enteropelogenes]
MSEIHSITLQGFKSILEPQTLVLKPLTIISGTNSAGKSSFMQAVLLLKQSVDSPYDSGEIKVNGSNVKFNDVNQMLSNIDGKRSKNFKITFDVSDHDFDLDTETLKKTRYNVSCEYGKENNSGLMIKSIDIDDYSSERPISLNSKSKEISGPALSRLSEMGVLGVFYDVMSKRERPADSYWTVVPRKCFFNVEYKIGKDTINSGLNICSAINDFCSELIHLPGLRGNPERTYEKIAMFDSFPGTFERYTASVIFNWLNKKQKKNIKKLEKDISFLGLGNNVEVRYVDDANLEICISKLPVTIQSRNVSVVNDDPDMLVSIADVGFGVSQALPILVALIVAKRGQVVYIEQPEIHLHPRAQANLVKPLIEASSRGVRVIIETHSSILLRALQTAVARDEIKSDDLSLNWFSRNENGSTKITTEIVDEFGAFGEWPVDFDDVYLKAENEYLDAVEQKYEKNR